MAISKSGLPVIVATATPTGTGGISIVRLSGDGAIKIADTLFSCKTACVKEFEERKMHLGSFSYSSGKNTLKENCLCVVFRSPRSFTGEDVVEFHIHGGVLLTNKIIKACIQKGARLAEAGEFSKRAYFNGKMSLSAAEGILDLINATSEAELTAAATLAGETLSKECTEIRNTLTDLIASIEAILDYPEEDFDGVHSLDIITKISTIKPKLDRLTLTATQGRYIKEGINVVIAGKPNTGKSSLLNSLTGTDRAIVTEHAGTTRDTISETYLHKGVKFNIIDTAGLRDSDNAIEKLGIKRSNDSIALADIVIFLADHTFNSDDKQILKNLHGKKVIHVYNKTDLMHSPPADYSFDIRISTLLGNGIEELKDAIYTTFIDQNIFSGGIIVASERHLQCIINATNALSNALKNTSIDLIVFELNEAHKALGQISGTDCTDEIIDRIFSKFCLGK